MFNGRHGSFLVLKLNRALNKRIIYTRNHISLLNYEVLLVFEINRTAIRIKPTQAFVNWINKQCMDPEDEITLEDAQEDCTIFLLPAFEDPEEVKNHIETIYRELFENELSTWFDDPSFWPTDLSYQMFCEFFTIKIHSLVLDTIDYDFLESEHASTTIQ